MKRMIAMTISPGDHGGGEADLTLADQNPPPAATSTKKKVPSSSEKSRRDSSLGSSHCSLCSSVPIDRQE